MRKLDQLATNSGYNHGQVEEPSRPRGTGLAHSRADAAREAVSVVALAFPNALIALCAS